MKTLVVTATSNLAHNSGRAFNYVSELLRCDKFICDLNTIKDCTGCGLCQNKLHKCCIKDDFSETIKSHYDRIILISPIYFFGLKGSVSTFIDRLYSKKIEGTEILAVLFSGSEGRDSGIDCIQYRFECIDDYCGTKSRLLQIVTDDKLLDVSEYANGLQKFLRGETNEVNKEV